MHWLNIWSDNGFKYLSQEFNGDLLELVKKKECIHMNISTVLKSFLKINYLIGVNFLVLSKMNALVKKTIHMLLMFGMCLKGMQWVIIMTFI